MPPKKATASEGETAGDSQGAKSAMQFNGKIPTDGDMKFLTAVMSSLKSKIDVEWDEVAKLTTLKDAKSARERYRVTKIKFGWSEKEAPPKTPGSGRGKKTAKDVNGDEPKSPTTAKVTKRKTPAKKKAVKVEADDEDVKAETEALNAAVKDEEQDMKELAGEV